MRAECGPRHKVTLPVLPRCVFAFCVRRPSGAVSPPGRMAQPFSGEGNDSCVGVLLRPVRPEGNRPTGGGANAVMCVGGARASITCSNNFNGGAGHPRRLPVRLTCHLSVDYILLHRVASRRVASVVCVGVGSAADTGTKPTHCCTAVEWCAAAEMYGQCCRTLAVRTPTVTRLVSPFVCSLLQKYLYTLTCVTVCLCDCVWRTSWSHGARTRMRSPRRASSRPRSCTHDHNVAAPPAGVSPCHTARRPWRTELGGHSNDAAQGHERGASVVRTVSQEEEEEAVLLPRIPSIVLRGLTRLLPPHARSTHTS